MVDLSLELDPDSPATSPANETAQSSYPHYLPACNPQLRSHHCFLLLLPSDLLDCFPALAVVAASYATTANANGKDRAYSRMDVRAG